MDFEAVHDFGNAFNPARGTSKLTTSTLVQWLSEKITLPEDLQFDPKDFTKYRTIKCHSKKEGKIISLLEIPRHGPPIHLSIGLMALSLSKRLLSADWYC